jgi:hypothetical protein
MSYTHFERRTTRRYRFNAIVDILDAASYRFGASLATFALSLTGSVPLDRMVQEPRQRANAPADPGTSA